MQFQAILGSRWGPETAGIDLDCFGCGWIYQFRFIYALQLVKSSKLIHARPRTFATFGAHNLKVVGSNPAPATTFVIVY